MADGNMTRPVRVVHAIYRESWGYGWDAEGRYILGQVVESATD